MDTIRGLCFDLDGTLLTNDKEISTDTIIYLNAYMKSGGYVILASGRRIDDITQYVKQIGQDNSRLYIISSGGVYLYDSLIRRTKTFGKIHNEQLIRIQPLITEMVKTYSCVVVSERCNYILKQQMSFVDWLKNIIFRILKKAERIICVNDIRCIETEIEKIIVHTGNDQYVRNLLSDTPYFDVVLIESKQTDIRPLGINKSNAISYLINTLGIDKTQILVFGDDENDADVFAMFPNSVAMGNATKRIKEMSKYQTDSNEKNGVLTFLKNRRV